MKISIIICTHNPRQEYLDRTLSGLRGQSLTSKQWELILIDNASCESVKDCWDLSWHPNGQHVRESELGLTSARLRGIREASGELLLFVDDDNVLDSDYLEKSVEIAREWWMLGAWGGRIDPEYEMMPSERALPYVGMLAIRPVSRQVWSNDPTHLDSLPWGAGMCIRRPVAMEYLRDVEGDSIRRALGRTGKGLGSCEDLDLAQTSSGMGLGFGVFPELRLLHLIPKGRVDEDYLVRIHEGSITSLMILNAVKGLSAPPKVPSILRKLIEGIRFLWMAPLERKMWRARQRAYKSAREVCKKHGVGST